MIHKRNGITNPPYKYAQQFVERAIEVVTEGHKVAMLLRLQFLEGKARRALFDKYPPRTVYVSSSRLICARNGDFEGVKKIGGSAIAFAWFVWVKGFNGGTRIQWVN